MTASDDPLAVALAIAKMQVERLSTGDIEGYIQGLDQYEAACRIVCDVAQTVDPGRLAELAELDARTRAMLDGAAGQLGARLAAMRISRHASGAYLAATPVPREPFARA